MEYINLVTLKSFKITKTLIIISQLIKVKQYELNMLIKSTKKKKK